MSEAPISTRLGIPEAHRHEAGLIIYAAFERKLGPLLGAAEQVRRALASGLDLDLAIGAFSDGRLVGVAGLHLGWRQIFTSGPGPFLRELGPLRGLYAWLALGLFAVGHCPRGQLRIAALAVDELMRGRGVGMRLLEAVFAYAEERQLRAVRLEVVDTNIGARRLYERVGFRAVRTRPFPFVRDWLGFSASVEMLKPLALAGTSAARARG